MAQRSGPDDGSLELPYDIWYNIARSQLTQPNSHPRRQVPVPDKAEELQLTALNKTARTATLDAVKLDLYIQVNFYDCEHIRNIDPRNPDLPPVCEHAENTHPRLDKVFGDPRQHPIYQLREQGHYISCLDVNFRCQHRCFGSDATASTLAFLPAKDVCVLTLCPILHCMTRRSYDTLDDPLIEVLIDTLSEGPPPPRLMVQQVERALELLESLTYGVWIGQLSPEAATVREYGLGRTDDDLVFSDATWPHFEPIFKRILNELEALLHSGTPAHELASLAESFLSNYALCGEFNNPLDGNIDREALLSMYDVFGRFVIILCRGLAEYLLLGSANVEDQSHHIFDTFAGPSLYWRFRMIDQFCELVDVWARIILSQYFGLLAQDSAKHGNSRLIPFSIAVIQATNYLSLAMLRVDTINSRRRDDKQYECYLTAATRLNAGQNGEVSVGRYVLSFMQKVQALYPELRYPHMGALIAESEMQIYLGNVIKSEQMGKQRHKLPLLNEPSRLHILHLDITEEALDVIDLLRNSPNCYFPVRG